MLTSSLRPPSKNTRVPRVNSSRAPPKRDRPRRAALATPRSFPKSLVKRVTTRSLSPSGNPPMTTAEVLPSGISGRQQEAELAEGTVILAPVAPDLNGQPQEDLNSEECFHIAAGGHPDLLEHGPAATDEDAFLRVLLDEHGSTDVDPLGTAMFGELVHPHRHRVGHLIAGQVEDLLPDEFRHPEGLRLVAGRLRWEKSRMLGHRRHDEIEEPVAVEAGQG